MEISKEDFYKAIETLKEMKPVGPPRLSFDAWSTLIVILTDALQYAMKVLFKDDGTIDQKPGIWKKLKLGGYFIIFIIKVVKVFKGR